MSRAFLLDLGDAHRKLIFLTYADYANEDGSTTWATARQLSVRSNCSTRTVRRHVMWLLENGWLREGEQDSISDGWKKRPPASRPIVYDMTTDEDTRRRWAAEYKPGKRAEAAAYGLDGALVANASRGDDADIPDVADILTPTPASAANGQVAVADTESATPSGGCFGVTHPLTDEWQAPPDAQESANTFLALPGGDPSSRCDASHRNGGAGNGAAGAQVRSRPKRQRTARTPEDQALFEQASDIANRWWKHRKEGGVIVGDRFVGLRDGVILAALRGGATVRQVENALVACDTTFPSAKQFEDAIRGGSRNGHHNGRVTPSWQETYSEEDHEDEWPTARPA
jgi:Helix-turn-helix domain